MKTQNLHEHLTTQEKISVVSMAAIAFFMDILDTTVVNVSVPTIAGSMGVSVTDGTLVITSYGISMAISTLIAGWISRKLGAIYAFCGATVAFGFFSFMCGAATNIDQIIVFRVLQGAVAGPIGPTCFLLLRVALPPKFGNVGTALFGMIAITAPALGPYFGGILTDNFGWSFIFYINIPFALLSTFIIFNILNDENDPVDNAKFDFVGFAFIVISVSSLQILLDKGKDYEWFDSTFIVVLALTSLISFIILLIWELGVEHPLINFSLFRSRNFVGSALVISIFFIFFMGANVLLPIVLETVLDYTTKQAGQVNLLLGVSPFFLMPLVAGMMSKVDLRKLIIISGILMFVSIYWRSTFYNGIDFFTVSISMIFLGAGVSFLMPPLMQLIVSDFKGYEVVDAQALTTFSRTMCGAFGTSIATTVFDHQTKVHFYDLIQYITPTNINFNHYVEITQSNAYAVGTAYKTIMQQAMLLGSNDYYVWAAFATLASVMLIYIAKYTVATGMPGGH